VDTAAALQRCIETLNAIIPAPDLVVISGDLVDTPDEAEYTHLTTLLAALKPPFACVPGNHDSRELMRAAFPDQGFAAAGPLNHVRSIGELDVVLIDSSVPGKPFGELSSETLEWLDTTLAGSDRPALLFLHHPPFRTGIWHMDCQNLLNAEVFERLIRGYPRVRHVAAGHVHRATSTNFAGTTATIAPAPNHAVDLDLGELREPSFRVEPPALHLHIWFAHSRVGTVVTHHVPIGQFGDPSPFFGPDGRLL
jgi:3',5'-cyclic-AMP phosphodiesterase